MKISAEKTKLMTNSSSGINTEIKLNGQKLETVTGSRYLGSLVTYEGSKPEVLSRIVKGGRRQGRQKKRWEDNIREWTDLEFTKSHRAVGIREEKEEAGGEVICGAPVTLTISGIVEEQVKKNRLRMRR